MHQKSDFCMVEYGDIDRIVFFLYQPKYKEWSSLERLFPVFEFENDRFHIHIMSYATKVIVTICGC